MERDAEKKRRKDPSATRLGRRQQAASEGREAPVLFFVAGTHSIFSVFFPQVFHTKKYKIFAKFLFHCKTAI